MRILIFFYSLLISMQTYNVLVYMPKFGYSHMKFMNQIGTILIEAGHNVTVLYSIVNHEEKDVKTTGKMVVVPQDPRTKEIQEKHLSNPDGEMKDMWTSELDMSKLTDMLTKMYSYQCENNMKQTEILNQLRDSKFDIAISEVFDFCGHGIVEMLKIPSVIAVSSSTLIDHQAKIFGVPLGLSYVPSCFQPGYSDHMTLPQRVVNLIGSHMGSDAFLSIMESESKLFKKNVSPNFRDLKEIVADSSFMLINSIPLLDFPRPIIHKVINIGGIGVPTIKPLDAEWNDILNRRIRNVYISFGSVAKSFTMPKHYKEGIIQLAREMSDVTFIWKYEADDLTNIPENLVLSKWTPQNDLIADERLSLFVTHGGLGSTTELAMSGCPALLVPLFAEQPRNAGMLKRHGGAEMFSKYDIPKPVKFRAAIESILNNKQYKENAKRLSHLITNAPFSSQEVLVKHVEFAAKFGKLPQLDPYGRQQSFIQYFLLDILGILVAIILTILLIIWHVIRVVRRKLQTKLKTK